MRKNLLKRSFVLTSILIFSITGIFAQNKFKSTAEDFTNLKITEISYHPLDIINGIDTTFGGDLEFIEFKNIGESSINLTGLVLDSAVYYEFPNDILLGPKKFWVVAAKPAKFLQLYGVEPSGNFSGNLSNGGEEILVNDALGNPVIHFIYDDGSPWPQAPDGEGYTLVSSFFNPTTNPNDEVYWRSSLKLNGSPFRDDDGGVGIKTNTLTGNTDLNIFPNPANDFITIILKDIAESQIVGAKIYSVNGTLVYNTEIVNTGTINLKAINLKNGLYFIKVETGSTIETSKFIYSE